MRIGIVSIGEKSKSSLYVKMLEKKLLSESHNVTHFAEDAGLQERIYLEKHLIFFVDIGSLFARTDYLATIESFLKSKSEHLPRYASLYVVARAFCNKPFLKIMTLLENYGFVLQDTDIVHGKDEMKLYIDSFQPAS